MFEKRANKKNSEETREIGIKIKNRRLKTTLDNHVRRVYYR